ncbi:MAG TPA: glycosyltransferase family 2 protein [Hanamia sp.]|nr:glycosyltransferase family 2 protein [Hanamia sp.]
MIPALQLSVIIVNYNVKYFLELCLLSVEKALKNIEGEIIVIDNHSTDGSFDFFKNRFVNVTFIWNKTNTGFAKANNQALKIARGNFILFLNPDTIVSEDCFEKCLFFIQSKNNEIALGIKMLDGSGQFLKESKRSFPTPATSFYKLSGLSKLFPHSKIFSRYHLGNLNENETQPVDVLAGAFMLIPKKILDITGAFDEAFFMYGEDIDLSYRIQKAGFENYYFAESAIIHFKGESTRKGSLNYVKMFYKAMSIFVKKHFRQRPAWLYNFFLHAAIFLRGSASAFSRMIKIKKEKKEKLSSPAKVIIAGSEMEFTVVKHLLEKSSQNKIVSGRVETGKIRAENTIAGFSDLLQGLSISSAEEIIFCEGTLSFKEIISAMQVIPKNIAIKIFANSSHSIVGSDNKDDCGEIILEKENPFYPAQ